MTLTTHAIIGAAAARIFSFNPVLAGIAAFASHFLIDTIPHWDYELKSARKDRQNRMNDNMVINRDFFIDLTKVAFDASLGVTLSLLFFWPHSLYGAGIIVMGAVLGILPDPLQFVYWKIRREPLISLQRLHRWIHNDSESLLGHWAIGAALQIVLIVPAVIAALYAPLA